VEGGWVEEREGTAEEDGVKQVPVGRVLFHDPVDRDFEVLDGERLDRGREAKAGDEEGIEAIGGEGEGG